jgi:subtilase family serine protease
MGSGVPLSKGPMKRRSLPIAGIAMLITASVSAPALAAPALGPASSVNFCAPAEPGHATCLAKRVVSKATRSGASVPSGFGPGEIRSAYNLSAKAGSGRTVAVVGAYDDPTAESDLATYRKKFNLAPCTTKNGCFRKMNQTGGSARPKFSAGWASESSLDIEMVSAACASCKILLVEATTSSMSDLATAVNYAATQRVSAISNSYGSSDTTQSAAYNHPGIAVVAAAGDSGYGAGAPASFSTVIAVGGTSLKKSKNARGWTETAWGSSGSLCATKSAKPAWQTSSTKCSGKGLADVSAVADPNTGVAVYIGTKINGVSGWQVTGGTSAAAPIIAGVYAMSGRTSSYPASYTWAHASGLNDVTSGANGKCATAVWCKAGRGWDGPTGLGTPNGTSSF